MITDQELRVIEARALRVLRNGTTSGSARALALDALRLTEHLKKSRKASRKRQKNQREIKELNQLFDES